MISEKEQLERIDRCFTDFSLILPVYSEEQRRIVRMTLKEDVAILIPAWFRDLAIVCKLHRKEFLDYAIFIRDSLDYILGDTDNYNEPEFDLELRQKLDKELEIMRINAENKATKELKPYVK